ncbi:MAG: aldehyde-activating protein [Pseudomonadota bacterium]
MTASALALSALFSTEGFATIGGETVIGGLHGPEQHDHHCGHCFSWLFTRVQGFDHVVNVWATMFDDTTWFVPFLETATGDRLACTSFPARRTYPSIPQAAAFADRPTDYAAWDPTSFEET